MKGIVKHFAEVKALDGVDFSLEEGEIHSLLGENGAGKTTLMKVLYGMITPDVGEIFIKGKKVAFKGTLDAIEKRIGMIHQHFMLIPVLTVAENIVAGMEPKKGILFDYEQAVKQVEDLCEKYGFKLDVRKKVSELSVGEQQRVEILKILFKGADILIMDEPTAVLTPIEVKELFSAMRQLKSDGKSMIIITHKLQEIMEIADRVTIMRDGKGVGSILCKESSQAKLAQMMVGREIALGVRNPSSCIGGPILEVTNLTYVQDGIQVLNDINLVVHCGEILGIAGIEGNGQSQLLEVLTGIRKPISMDLRLNGKVLEGTVADFIEKGIGHVPEDRMTRGLVQQMSICENIILGYESSMGLLKRGFFRWKKALSCCEDLIKTFEIKPPSATAIVSTLSGGNQQKVVIARVFAQNPKIVICAQPTRGVDVSSIERIHEIMISYRNEGKGILLISADLEEIKKMSDTVAVLYKGKIVALGKPEEFDDTRFGMLMAGGVDTKEREVKLC